MSNTNGLKGLIDEGVDCFNRLEDYVEKLNRSVGTAIQKAVKSNSDKERLLIRWSIEINNHAAGRLRASLNTQERRMAGLIDGIDRALRELEKEPKTIFVQGITDIKKATKEKARDGITLL